MLGLWLVGRRFGGLHLGAMLAFAWAAYPFTQYASSSNTNDALLPCFLIWGFWLVVVAGRRAARSARSSGWTKFASLVVAPLWLTYPDRRPSRAVRLGVRCSRRSRRSRSSCSSRTRCTSCACSGTARSRWQVGRESPWSLWDWRQYHARGIPTCTSCSACSRALLVAVRSPLAFVPRRKSPLQLAALTAALLAGFELVLTYWLYTYIPWFFPFAAIALLAPRGRARAPRSRLDVDADELDPARPAVV